MSVAQVVVEGLVASIDKTYDYRIPANLIGRVCPGMRVLVPFGAGNVKRQALVTALLEKSEYRSLKSVHSLLNERPMLDSRAMELLRWMKGQYFCGWYDCVKALLPSGARLLLTDYYLAPEAGEPPADGAERRIWDLLSDGVERTADELAQALDFAPKPVLRRMAKQGSVAVRTLAKPRVQEAVRRVTGLAVSPREAREYADGLGPRGGKHRRVIELLLDNGDMPTQDLCELSQVGPGVVKTLEKKGILETGEVRVYRNPYSHKLREPGEEQPLSPEQTAVADSLLELMNAGAPKAALLHGVTGSGKTLVYMRLIDEALRQGGGVLMLVPEISLTPQLTDRFFMRYGDRVAVLHSGLSYGERYDEWCRIRDGEARVVVGTRSAVFAPVHSLRLIVLDEEQEHTYKSESSPRYHARDIARFRAAQDGALMLLGSATPSVESYRNALSGRYRLLELQERYGGQGLPEVLVADMRRELKAGNRSVIGSELRAALGENLAAGQQSILFLNRRGYTTFISCRDCGHVVVCPHCTVSMTYHRPTGLLMCHYCGHADKPAEVCPECGSRHIRHFGTGTQKVEEELQGMFPSARILRMDTDTTSYKLSHEKLLKAFGDGEYDILLGTQMVTKGLDMPDVTLVGVLAADSLLYVDDFRAGERAFSLLTQVIGRAGRASLRGRAVIQTYTPESPVIELARRQDYKGFYAEEVLFRNSMVFPPFCDLCRITLTALQEERAVSAAGELYESLTGAVKASPEVRATVFEPQGAKVLKISEQYRYQLTIKCKNDKKFRQVLSTCAEVFYNNRKNADVSLSIDINPLSAG